MAFIVYARPPVEKGRGLSHTEFEPCSFEDSARYEILPSGVLVVDTDGEGSYWVLSPDRWLWVKAHKHAPTGSLGADV